ncbi:hypothetical protein XENTR_v10015723 [Xenopus tropicalis]|nr:hypothetical protein XENTR_v10015723 [Xenopus tropicalis]
MSRGQRLPIPGRGNVLTYLTATFPSAKAEGDLAATPFTHWIPRLEILTHRLAQYGEGSDTGAPSVT